MATITTHERIVGALMGAFVGEALAVGPHWYYDLDALHAAYGTWIDDYTTPKKGRYHDGLQAGDSSQPGWLLHLTMESLVACGRYDRHDWCKRIDDTFFPLIDGTPNNGPGGYTSQSMRHSYEQRVRHHQPWDKVAGPADTTEAAERILAIAARYALSPKDVFQYTYDNTMITQNDSTIGAMTVAYGLLLALLIQGEAFDHRISDRLMAVAHDQSLPFHTVTQSGLGGVADGPAKPLVQGQFPSPDALLTQGAIARAAADPDIRIEPASKVSLVYGMPCAAYHQFPAVYYLAARFHADFESAVLHAVNAGGQNQARAMLTGALVGAQVGIGGIPQRFLDGLKQASVYQTLATTLADQAQKA